jgi:hypothetical protein
MPAQKNEAVHDGRKALDPELFRLFLAHFLFLFKDRNYGKAVAADFLLVHRRMCRVLLPLEGGARAIEEMVVLIGPGRRWGRLYSGTPHRPSGIWPPVEFKSEGTSF